MPVPSRATTTWALALGFLLVTGVGEGWHLVPGNGHFIALPGGCLCVGIELSASDPGWSGRGSVLTGAARNPIRRADESDCLICRLLGQGQSRAEGSDWAAAAPFRQDVRPLACPALSAPILAPFRPRAPPRV